jgi:protein tyrosine/serine phosphatase
MKSLTSFSFLRAAAVALVIPFATSAAFAGGGSTVAAVSASEIIASKTSSMGPLALSGIELSNFGVVDGRIFRGEQPKGADFAALKAIGVQTIIDLREDSKSTSRHDAEAAGLRYINIKIDGHGTPTAAQAAEFIKAVEDPANGVVYAHCAGGRHRTGSMIAAYRMTKDGWTLEQAYDEMLKYDFYTGGGHKGFKTFVEDYARNVCPAPTN